VERIADVHRCLRRAFQLSLTLPNAMLERYRARASQLLVATEAERMVLQRLGQDVFREGLLEYWDFRCPLTGLDVPELLRASHIKPWAHCETDAERLDVFNGFLFAPHLDAAFDRGFFTISDAGILIITTGMGSVAKRVLGLDRPSEIRGLTDAHRGYLTWHRDRVFRA
jgi:predicted restriction endonuclease